MSSIKILRMWESIRTDSRIGIKKTMLGLKTTAIYKPTGNVIDARLKEYSPQDGGRLLRILETPTTQLADAIGDFRPKEVPNGNYLLEVARSRDGQFVALQLLQFSRLSYEPVTDVLLFEADGALAVNKLFN